MRLTNYKFTFTKDLAFSSVPKYSGDLQKSHLGTQMGPNFLEIGDLMRPNFSKSPMKLRSSNVENDFQGLILSDPCSGRHNQDTISR